MAKADQNDPRVHFAAERTFLAWIRTGLALMGFGFVVARFGLFLRELAAVHGNQALKSSGFSLEVGTALIVVAVIVTVASAANYVTQISQLKLGSYEVGKPSLPALALAFILAVAGVALAIYVVLVR
jgi:putative membrane protein